jgi:hypothetical protein
MRWCRLIRDRLLDAVGDGLFDKTVTERLVADVAFLEFLDFEYIFRTSRMVLSDILRILSGGFFS